MSNVATVFSGLTRSNAGWRLLLRAAHPLQALVVAVVLGVLALLSHRGPKESLVAAAAVLLVQLATGLLNDLCDAAADRRADLGNKPVATGEVPPGNVTYMIVVLVLVAIPVSLQNGTLAGLALLATLPVAYVHDRILHRTAFSFVGWMATFVLFVIFLAYGGWGGGRHGAAPTWQFMAAAALLGLCVHFVLTLPDLVADNNAGTRNLPLRIALHTGAPRLLLITAAVTIVSVALLVIVGINPGLRV